MSTGEGWGEGPGAGRALFELIAVFEGVLFPFPPQASPLAGGCWEGWEPSLSLALPWHTRPCGECVNSPQDLLSQYPSPVME